MNKAPSALRRLMLAVTVIGMLLVAGCASAHGVDSQSLGAKVLQNPSAFEMRALKDKHVSQAEFDESKQIYAECLKAAGLKVFYPNGDGDAWVEGTGTAGPDVDKKMDNCSHQVDAVQAVWTLQNQVSASDLNKTQDTFISCLKDAGLPIKDGSTFTDAEKALSQFTDSLPSHYDNESAIGVKENKVETCQQDFQSVAGAQPLPGLGEALAKLNTSGW